MKYLSLKGIHGEDKFAIVDDDLFDYFSQYNYLPFLHRHTWYAFRYVRINGKQKRIMMHQEIMGKAPEGFMIDHINRNGLDNRRENLRVCTNSQNRRNSKIQSNNTLGYKGISLDKRTGTYRVRLTVDGKRKSMGYYPTAIIAARAYDTLAKEHYGEFALLNFPE